MVGAFYQKEIRIAYHRNRMWAAAENWVLLEHKPGRKIIPKLDGLRILLFRMTARKEQEAMEHHEKSLLTLGYFEKREFWLANHFTGWSNISPPLQEQVTNTFDTTSH